MRKALLMAAAALAICAPAASAQVSLAWGTCGGVANDAFACNTNTGNHFAVASWHPNAAMVAVEGIEVYVDYVVDAATLPCWWNFSGVAPTGRGAAAQGALIQDQTAQFGCEGNYFTDNGGFNAGAWVQTGLNRGAFRYAGSVGAGTPGSDPDDVEQLGMAIRIGNTQTLNVNCVGCTTPACLVLNRIVITQPNLPNIELNQPATQQHVTWRGAGAIACPAATPTQKATWGSIKALYR